MTQQDKHLARRKSTSCAIYGMGKAGRSLYLSCQKNQISVHAFFMRHPQKLKNFSPQFEFNLTPAYSSTRMLCTQLQKKQTEILFLAVPDDAIEQIAHSLRTFSFLPPLIVHLSGALSFSILQPLSHRCSLAQFHPLASLNGQNPIPSGTLNAICASNFEAQETLIRLSQMIKLTPSLINDGMQSLYHTAASIVGNLPIALLADSIDLMARAGIDRDLARVGLAKLLCSTAKSAEKKTLSNALTGPIARGDTGTVEQHLLTLQQLKENEQIEIIYRLLSQKLIALNEDPEKRQQFKKLLAKTD